jgi:DNA polymerase III gamma/tau subunit
MGTQNAAEVVQNVELIAVIANQQAADAMPKAADALANGADPEAAVQQFASAKQFIVECAASALTSEAAALLDEHERKI